MDNKTFWNTSLECGNKVGTNRSISTDVYKVWVMGNGADKHATVSMRIMQD